MISDPRILYPQLIDTVILPALARSFQAVKGPIVFHHGGNPILPCLAAYLSLPKVVAFAIDHRDPLAQSRELLGPTPLLLGNVNGPALSRTPPEKVMEDIGRILDDRHHDPCFIVASAGADVPWATPPELLRDILATIRAAARPR